MKKNGYPCAVLLLLLVVSTAAFAQRRMPAAQPQKLLAGLKQAALQKAKAAKAFNARTAHTLSCSTDSLVFRRQSQIDSFPITNPGCTVLRELRIYGGGASPAITNLDSLKYITEITGFFEVDSTALTNLNGLSGLQRTAWLWLGNNPLMTAVKPPNLTYVGSVLLNQLPQFTSFSGFTQNLTSTKLGYLWLFNNVGITNFNGLQSLDTVENFAVFGPPNLTSLQGLQNLRYCNDIALFGCGNLTDVSALSGITQLPYGSLKVNYCGSLTSWNGLQNIIRIGSILEVIGSPFTSLSGLNSSLIIENANNPDDTLRIENNYQLSACSFPPLCEYLNRSNAASVHDNDAGCNSITEIKSSCGINNICNVRSLRTWTGSTSDDWNAAANWNPVGVPQPCDSVVIPSGPQRPRLTSNAEIGALTMESGTELYMNGFSLTVNGDVNAADAYIHSGPSFTVLRSRNSVFDNNSVYVDTLDIRNLMGALNLQYNSFNPYNNAETLVRIADSIGRVGNVYTAENFVQGNLFVTANSTQPSTATSIGTNDEVAGNVDFEINSPVFFTAGDAANKLRIAGNLSVFSNLSGGPTLNGIKFIGSSNSHISKSGTAEALRIAVLETGKNFGGQLTLDNNVLITDDMKFGVGLVNTSPTALLSFAHNAKISQTSSASWVNGPLKKIGQSPFGVFTFPIGDAVRRGTMVISNPGQPTDEFTARYYYANPTTAGYDTSQHASTLTTVSGKEYWTLDYNSGPPSIRTAGGYSPNVYVTLLHDSTHSQRTTSINDLRVARWNGTQWTNQGVSSVTGNYAEAYVRSGTSQFSFGPFTLGYVPTPIPVITLTTMDTVVCGFTPFWVRWTVDTPMIAGNVFNVYLSDSAGNFTFNNGAGYFLGSKASNRSDSLQVSINTNGIPPGNNYKIRVTGTQPTDTSVNVKTFKLRTVPTSTTGFFYIVGPSLPCAGTPLKYYAANRLPTATGYTWNINGGTILQQAGDTVIVSWNNPPSPGYYGSFYLQLTAYNACGNGASNYFLPTLYFPPPATAPVVSKTGRWLNVQAPPPNQGISVNWYRDTALVATTTGLRYYASLAGTYTARFVTGCGTGPLSNAVVYAANAVPQSITLTPIPDKVFSDSSFTVNATASSGLPVEFQILRGPGTIPGNVFNITGTGTVIIRATQPGNDVYDTAAYVLDTFVVNKASQTITFAPLPDRTYPATPFALNASSTSALPVTFSIVSGPATVSSNTLTVTGVGTVTVRASQAGDTNYLAATAVDRSFCVRIANLGGINGPISICPGIAATYTALKVPGATYTWRLQGGTTFSSTNDTLRQTWPSPGTYTLIVSAAGPCGAPSKTDTLVVTAITSVAPDSVRAMLPANGAVNQQLPLNLSWIPANPNLYYTYDLYLWKTSDPQPATPYASNLTTVNYTLPLNSGLAYNTTYKWMVAAHNGSCTQINTGPVQTFSLIPLPDLQVFNVTAPATAFSGQQVSVTWKVKNNGPGNTLLGQRWTDAVFISKDSVLSFVNAGQLQFPVVPMLVAGKPNVSALNIGEQYNDTASFTLPIDYAGPLYFHVITNYQPPAANPVIETTYANDTARAAPGANVTLSPQPDFRVDTVLNPNNTFSGSTINVTFKVKNYGVTGTGSWVDKIYLSKDAVFNPATALRLYYPIGNGAYFPQVPLDLQRNNSSLQADSSYTVNVSAVVPNFIFGQYYVYVVTKATASLYEGPNNGNNVNRGPLMQIFLTQTPLLTPTNVSVPSVITTAQTVAVGWSTYNKGAYDNIQKNLFPFGKTDSLHPWGFSQWYDRAFISTDSSLLNVNSDFLIANVYQNSDIYPGKAFPASQNWVVSDNLATGDYWLYVFANATRSVFEYPGLPQIVRSQKITVVKPDLSVPSVSAPTTGASGQSVVVNYTVANNSNGAVSDRFRKDYFYLGTNPSFDGTAVQIDEAGYGTYILPAKGSVALQKTVTLPNGISGAKYLFVKANAAASFSESDFTNNTSAGSLVNVSLTPPPDLVVTAVSMVANVTSNTGFPFAYTVANNGPGLAQGSWKDSVYVSCNGSFNPATAFFVAERPQQAYVAAGSNYSDSFNLKMPQTFLLSTSGCMNNDVAQVYFFVKTNANNGVYENNTANNTGGTPQRTVTNAIVDLIVSSVRHDDTLTVGRGAKLAWTVKNLGLNPGDDTYNYWIDGLYLSTDTVLSGDDRLVGQKGENFRLNQNATYSDSAVYTIPDLPQGDYYLLVKTNAAGQIPAERNTANNTGVRRAGSNVPLKVFVRVLPPPDLTVVYNNAPASVAVGQPLKFVFTVTNNGAGATYPGLFYHSLWLSTSFNEGGYFVGQKPIVRTLQPGESVLDSMETVLPLNFVQGNYVAVLRTNSANSVYEANYANDYAYHYISVYTPAPVDLVVRNVSAPDTVLLGYPATVGWRIFNNSANPAAGTETDGVYLSTDSASSNAADVLVGTKVNALSLLPLNDTALSLQPVISNVAEGSYYLKVRTDILRNIIETNTANNTGLLNKKVYVKVKVLPLNAVTPDALTNTYLYYKLIIPTALRGKTVQVKLTSDDSLTATNQLYIGLGYLPSAARFDYSGSAASGGNQSIIIESVVDSVYYIAARSTRPGTQTISLQAIQLPFALLTVNSNRGGNSGNVTVKLSGSLFTNNMTAKIRGVAGNNIIAATAFYFVNGTTAYATFNLRGAPLGVYDVSLTKPDSSLASLPSSFTVEATNSGGLLTGGGNTGQSGSGNAPGCDPGAAGGLNTQLQTDLVIPPKVFNNWPFVITINYTNASNVDIPAQVRVLYSHDGAPLALTEAGLPAGKTSLALEFKDSFGALNVIRAGSTGTIRVYAKAPAAAGAHSIIHFNLQ